MTPGQELPPAVDRLACELVALRIELEIRMREIEHLLHLVERILPPPAVGPGAVH
ncbi:hypothetical protein JYK14_02935 [Siccirubricoccus sp. KC 17139]|uniref:SlyX family protein n=1 Tax=Siccirubricoccus soli TaxID=2899147 RepID=A0ABT1CZQ5_9PROT|nr:hypothetical protein [Siccirubricoccus soli]MCO6415132.1 hypothetical protein [Siccirubricoccus soli]MCP2681263.1 hypothetical protein [Siccirubricoccus soli]